MENLKLAALCGSIFLAGCTSPMDRPYHLDGKTGPGFAADLSACKASARKIGQDARQRGALLGAGAGAVMGALDAEGDAGSGAMTGALAGVSAAEEDLSRERRRIVIRCLQNRGHNAIG